MGFSFHDVILQERCVPMFQLSESSESLFNDVVSAIPQLTNLELD